jgi:ATP-binding cassette subfamily F protein uup
VFEKDGQIQSYVGGYSEWLRQGHELAQTDDPFGIAAAERKQAHVERRKQQKPTKLSYKDQRELDRLPAEIEAIEASISTQQQGVSESGFYTQPHDLVQEKLEQLADSELLLEQRIERWSELEMLQETFQ